MSKKKGKAKCASEEPSRNIKMVAKGKVCL